MSGDAGEAGPFDPTSLPNPSRRSELPGANRPHERITGCDTQRDIDAAEWNAALASGDAARISRTRTTVIDRIFTRVMDDNPEYVAAGWQPSKEP